MTLDPQTGKDELREALISYATHYGARCRDCADENGICPSTGIGCGDRQKAVGFVVDALIYGASRGVCPRALTTTSTEAQTEPSADGVERQAFTWAFARGYQIADETSRSCMSAMDDAWADYQEIVGYQEARSAPSPTEPSGDNGLREACPHCDGRGGFTGETKWGEQDADCGACEGTGRRAVSSAVRERCDWPDEPFSFHDEPGEHDPCYVVMPGGACLPLNHHAGEGVDIARAKFIVDACNAAINSTTSERAAVLVTPGDVMLFADEAFRNMDVDLGLDDVADIQRAMQSTFDRLRALAAPGGGA